MVYSEDGKIIAEMFNDDFVKLKGITNIDEVFAEDRRNQCRAAATREL